jgi:amino acid adenylation domain-containing protein
VELAPDAASRPGSLLDPGAPTRFAALVAGFCVVLSRFTGADDLLLGVECEIGLLPLRVRIEPTTSVLDLVAAIHRGGLDGAPTGAVELDRTAGAANLPARCQVVVRREAANTAAASGIDADLVLVMGAVGAPRTLAIEYDRAIGDLTMASFVRAYEHVLAQLERHSGPVDDVALQDGSDSTEPVLSRARPGAAASPWAMFATAAARSPDAVAATDGASSLTYRALGDRAGLLAAALVAAGSGPGDVVALCVGRGLDYAVALLATVRAGAAFLPVDAALPRSRRRQMLARANARLVLTPVCDDPGDWACGLGIPTLPVDAHGDRDLLVTRASGGPDDLAYVLFTSGTTGEPKGAMVENAGMANHLEAKIADLRLVASDVVAQTARVSFDISIWQYLAPLCVGARVAILSDEVSSDPSLLVDELRASEVTVWEAVPAVLARCIDRVDANDSNLPFLRVGLATGEPLVPELARRWFAAVRTVPLVNAYGPTECADDVTHHQLDEAPPELELRVPVGRPIPGVDLYVLDPRGRAVPRGFPGELVVGGVAVGRGYVGDPDRTARSFPPAGPGPRAGRLYRTGDRARLRDDGAIEVLGRLDEQLKVNGVRVEPGEVEATLADHPDVLAAAVRAWDGADGSKHLVGYLVLRTGAALDRQGMRRFAADRLPATIVPTRWQVLDRLPLTAHGKVDRAGLPSVRDDDDTPSPTGPAPGGELGRALSVLWQSALGHPPESASANFLDEGGDSLLATQLVAGMRDALGIHLSVGDVLARPTFGALVEQAADASACDPERPALRRGARSDRAPLTAAQRGIWLREQIVVGDAAYNMPVALLLHGAVDRAVVDALTDLWRRHAALRTLVRLDGQGEPYQRVQPSHARWQPSQCAAAPSGGPVFPADVSEAAAVLASRAATVGLDPAREVFRAEVFRLTPDDLLVVMVVHHIAADGLSLAILLEDFATAYGAVVRRDRDGAGSPGTRLPATEPATVEFTDFAHWLSHPEMARSRRRSEAYWRGRLAGARFELPFTTIRPARRPGARRAARIIRFDVGGSGAIRRTCQALGVTPFMVLYAAWLVVLHRCTGMTDLTVLVPMGQRVEPGTQRLVGLLLDTVPLRVVVDPSARFRRLVDEVRRQTLAAQTHGTTGVVPPSCNSMFVMDTPLPAPTLPGVGTRVLPVHPGGAKFDLTLFVDETGQGARCLIEHAVDAVGGDEADVLARRFGAVVDGLDDALDTAVHSIAVAGPGRDAARASLSAPIESLG